MKRLLTICVGILVVVGLSLTLLPKTATALGEELSFKDLSKRADTIVIGGVRGEKPGKKSKKPYEDRVLDAIKSLLLPPERAGGKITSIDIVGYTFYKDGSIKEMLIICKLDSGLTMEIIPLFQQGVIFPGPQGLPIHIDNIEYTNGVITSMEITYSSGIKRKEYYDPHNPWKITMVEETASFYIPDNPKKPLDPQLEEMLNHFKALPPGGSMYRTDGWRVIKNEDGSGYIYGPNGLVVKIGQNGEIQTITKPVGPISLPKNSQIRSVPHMGENTSNGLDKLLKR
jgi:hypothetical protein